VAQEFSQFESKTRHCGPEPESGQDVRKHVSPGAEQICDNLRQCVDRRSPLQKLFRFAKDLAGLIEDCPQLTLLKEKGLH
jgi:hypothetical protein